MSALCYGEVYEARPKTVLRDVRNAFELIVSFVEKESKVSRVMILGGRRTKRVAQARHDFFFLARYLTEATLAEIGGFCGGKDHTTVVHGIEKHTKAEAVQASRELLIRCSAVTGLEIREQVGCG